MDERQPPPPRNPSRTLAKVGVAVLVVIAIAGIVLATTQRGLPAEGPVAADATHAASAPMTGASTSVSTSAAAAEAEGLANQVVFAPDSAQLSSAAKIKLLALAEKAKNDKRPLTIVGKVETRLDGREQRRQLVRNRAIAVRGVLEANGVPLSRMETRIEEPAFGLIAAKDANLIEVNPR